MLLHYSWTNVLWVQKLAVCKNSERKIFPHCKIINIYSWMVQGQGSHLVYMNQRLWMWTVLRWVGLAVTPIRPGQGGNKLSTPPPLNTSLSVPAYLPLAGAAGPHVPHKWRGDVSAKYSAAVHIGHGYTWLKINPGPKTGCGLQ